MTWSDLPWRPTARTLRQFAGLWVLYFGGMAAWHGLAHGRPVLAGLLAALALGVGLPGLVWPQVLRPLFVGWCVLVFPIGWLISRAILAGVFFGIVTPLALLFRWAGRDALRLRRPDGVQSCWVSKPQAPGPRSYLRQF